MRGTPPIRYRARRRRSTICPGTCELLAPHRDGGRALHDRPLVLLDVDQRVAVRLATLPRGAEAVLGELPGAFALGAGLVLRLARDLAAGHERHLELGARGG